MAGKHALTPDERARGIERAAEANRARHALNREARAQQLNEQLRESARGPNARREVTQRSEAGTRERTRDIADKLKAAGYQSEWSRDDLRVQRGQYQSTGRQYTIVEYRVILNDGTVIKGEIRGKFAGERDLQAAIFAKEGKDAFGYGDVAAVVVAEGAT